MYGEVKLAKVKLRMKSRTLWLVALFVVTVFALPACTEQPPELSSLGVGWAERLEQEIYAGNTLRIGELCEGIGELDSITTADKQFLLYVCSVAFAGNMPQARETLAAAGIVVVEPDSGPTSNTVSSLSASGDSVGVRGIDIPLPNRSAIIEQRKSSDDPVFADDVWEIQISASQEDVGAFYAEHFSRIGWTPDRVMTSFGRPCWTSPLPGTTTDEIVCVYPSDHDDDRFVISISP